MVKVHHWGVYLCSQCASDATIETLFPLQQLITITVIRPSRCLSSAAAISDVFPPGGSNGGERHFVLVERRDFFKIGRRRTRAAFTSNDKALEVRGLTMTDAFRRGRWSYVGGPARTDDNH